MSDTVLLIADPFGPTQNGQGPFASLPQPVLQQWLTDALSALHKLECGSKEVTVTYGMGDGQKSVTFARTESGRLRAHIQELQLALGQVAPRRGLRPLF